MENKTSKYFKYAIGEIVLVVIGILIALSINTWNENNKKEAIGNQYLTEMRYELQVDVFRLDYFIINLKKNIKNQEAALHTNNISTLPLDSLKMIITPINLDSEISELTYNKMKNLGMSILSDNDLLNSEITSYYNERVVSLKLSMAYVFDELRKYENYFQYQQSTIDYDDVYNVYNKKYEFPSLYQQSQEAFEESNRKNIIQFVLSTKGRNLVLLDLENKRYSLQVLKKFQSITISLLQSVYDELKNKDPQIEALPTLPKGYFLKLSEDILKKYVGEYQQNSNNVIKVTLKNKHLYVRFNELELFEVLPYEDNKFFFKTSFQKIQFNTENDKVISLTLMQRDVREYKKVE